MKQKLEDHGLTAYIQTITPATAKTMLEAQANPRNRAVSNANVVNYGRMMRDGNWMLNGEAIVIQSDGIIANGHNRLNAVIYSGVPVDFVIIEGVEPDAFATYDAGQKRTAAHVLQMDQIPNATNIASNVCAVIIYREAIKRQGSLNTYVRPSNIEILEEYSSNPQLYQMAYKLSGKCKAVCSNTPLGLVFSVALIDQKHEFEFVEDFANSLASGSMLAEGNPILTLRNALTRAKIERSSGSASRSTNWFRNACILAWNAHIEGRELKLIRFADVNKAIKVK